MDLTGRTEKARKAIVKSGEGEVRSVEDIAACKERDSTQVVADDDEDEDEDA